MKTNPGKGTIDMVFEAHRHAIQYWINRTAVQQTCPECRGGCYMTVQIPCRSCGGTGTLNCGACSGEGLIRNPIGQLFFCRTCGGAGLLSCAICGGLGEMARRALCSHCAGTGVVVFRSLGLMEPRCKAKVLDKV